jgi:hypothetical protein
MRLLFRGLRPAVVEDYPGVLVSLEEAHLYSHSARTGRTEFEEHPDDRGQHDGDVGKQDDETEGTGMLEMNATEYSIAGLRNEGRITKVSAAPPRHLLILDQLG